MSIGAKEIVSYGGYKNAEVKRKAKRYSPYAGKNFEGIKELSSVSKSSIIKQILHEYFSRKGIKVAWTAWRKSFHIQLPNGRAYKGVVKSSFLWGDAGDGGMRWEQIRAQPDDHIIIFVGIFPDEMKIRYAYCSDVRSSKDTQIQHGEETSMIHGDMESIDCMKPIDELLSDT